MKKQILISLLALAILSNITIAEETKGPSVERTIGFLNKVFDHSDHLYAKPYPPTPKYDETYSYVTLEPQFEITQGGKNECMITIIQDNPNYGELDRNIIYLDLSKQIIFYKPAETENNNDTIGAKDRLDLPTIIEHKETYKTKNTKDMPSSTMKKIYNEGISGYMNLYSNITEEFKIKKYSERLFVSSYVNGSIYINKVTKALNHLSNTCYDKYGQKEDKDPF